MPDESLASASVRPKRAVSQRVEHTDAVTTTATEDDPRFQAIRTELSNQLTNEIRTFEKHLSEWQGIQMTAYQQLTTTVVQLTTSVTDLTAQVGQLASDHRDAAQFISAKRTEDAAKSHAAELDAVAAKVRADIVLEQQALKDAQVLKDKQGREERLQEQKERIASRNKILFSVLSADITFIGGIAIYLVTDSGNQTSTSRVWAFCLIGFLVLFGFGLSMFINPKAALP